MIKHGKRYFSLTMSVILASTLLQPLAVKAADNEITFESANGTFKYTQNGNDITITSCDGSNGTVDLPELFSDVLTDEVKITTIGSKAFEDIDGMSSIVLPSSVTSLGLSSFYGCDGLTDVSFEDDTSSLAAINQSSFYSCDNLEAFPLPDSLSTIGNKAFYETALHSVTIPANCQTIGEDAFFGAAVTSITFAITEDEAMPSLSIGEDAFSKTDITSIELPERMANSSDTISIPNGLFDGCESLSDVTIPDNCTEIGAYTFDGCSALTSIDLPEQLTTIGEYSFRNSGITNITIPKSVQKILTDAFNGSTGSQCYNLGIIDFKGNPTTISSDAFTSKKDAPNLVFYCDPDATNVIGYATAGSIPIPYQYHTDELSFVTEPTTKEYFYGDKLDYTTGLSLSAKLTSDPENTYTLTATDIANCTVTGFDSTKVGKQTVTIAYGGAKVTYDVHVYYDMNDADTGYNTTIRISGDALGTYNPNAPHEPKPTLTNTITSTTLTEGTHYTLAYTDSDKAGTAKLSVTAIESTNYKGSFDLKYTINKRNIADEVITATVADKTYTGSILKPTTDNITLTYGDTTLVPGTDYQIKELSAYGSNTAVGTGTVIIEGLGNYQSQRTLNFKINRKNLADEDIVVEYDDTVTYNGQPQTPAVTVKYGELVLTEGIDYTVSYKNNTQAGTATITITAAEDSAYRACNYGGSVEKEFTIEPATLTADMITITGNTEYTGSAVVPEASVIFNNTILVSGTDYTVASESVNAGEAVATITGLGNFTGTVEKEYTITPASLENAVFSEIEDYDYTGEEIEPAEFTVTLGEVTLEADKDYTVSYENNVNAGYGTIVITGTGNYQGTADCDFRIAGIDISIPDEDDETAVSPFAVTLAESSYVYTGAEICPAVTVVYTTEDTTEELEKGTDYTVTYKSNTDCGTATVEVKGLGRFEGTISKTFTITPADLNDVATVTIGDTDTTYTGETITPEVTVSVTMLDEDEEFITYNLTEEYDYEVTYENNVNAGTASIIITGIDNYTGTITKEFMIAQKDVSNKIAVSGIPASVSYTGTPVTFDVKVGMGTAILTSGKDYDVTYTDNDKVGTATVTITLKGNYGGTITKSFTITAINLTTAAVTGITNAVYTGAPVTQPLAVTLNNTKLAENTDYKVSYTNNDKVGTATVTITSIGKYTGVITKTFTITPVTITDSHVTLDTSETVYASARPKLDLDVVIAGETLTENEDYTLTFANQNKPGRATVTITGIGNYTGTITKTFTVTPKKAVISSAQNKKSKKLVIKCKKEKGVSGYEITIATNRKFKAGKKVKNAKSGSYTFKKLAKKKYYVRVRAYVKVNGKKVYGAYSKIKIVNIKK